MSAISDLASTCDKKLAIAFDAVIFDVSMMSICHGDIVISTVAMLAMAVPIVNVSLVESKSGGCGVYDTVVTLQ